jgi:hypothetical protein
VTGGGSFTFGEEIVVTALANDCYMFIGWYEDGLLVSEENEFCFIVERDIELEARFVNAVKSKEFKFILENLFLGRKYEVTMKLDLRITKSGLYILILIRIFRLLYPKKWYLTGMEMFTSILSGPIQRPNPY